MLILSTSYLYIGTYSSSFRGEREGGVRGREGGGGGRGEGEGGGRGRPVQVL